MNKFIGAFNTANVKLCINVDNIVMFYHNKTCLLVELRHGETEYLNVSYDDFVKAVVEIKDYQLIEINPKGQFTYHY